MLAACACGARGSEGPPLSPQQKGEQLPCEIASILESRCQLCHTQPPQYGAPMPLVTLADFKAPARSDASQTVAHRVEARIHDARHPMPPAGSEPLTGAQLAVLDAWLASPHAGAACTVADAGPIDAGPADGGSLCTPDVIFAAHASDGGGYLVPSSEGDLYTCFAFRSPFDGGVQGTAIVPHLGDTRVLHHMVIYETQTPQPENVPYECLGKLPADSVFVAGWAPGRQPWVLPDDVGQVLPDHDHWLILQAHYHNLNGYTDAWDTSGIGLCTTSTPRPHAAAVTTLGTTRILLEPGQHGSASGTCTPYNTEPVHILSSTPHMHLLGQTLQTVIHRADGGESALFQIENYDFENQLQYGSPAVVQPGDVLETTCTYDNTTGSEVYFGETTADEMCFNFVLAYPAGELGNHVGGPLCLDDP